jgi:hypothetical protein
MKSRFSLLIIAMIIMLGISNAQRQISSEVVDLNFDFGERIELGNGFWIKRNTFPPICATWMEEPATESWMFYYHNQPVVIDGNTELSFYFPATNALQSIKRNDNEIIVQFRYTRGGCTLDAFLVEVVLNKSTLKPTLKYTSLIDDYIYDNFHVKDFYQISACKFEDNFTLLVINQSELYILETTQFGKIESYPIGYLPVIDDEPLGMHYIRKTAWGYQFMIIYKNAVRVFTLSNYKESITMDREVLISNIHYFRYTPDNRVFVLGEFHAVLLNAIGVELYRHAYLAPPNSLIEYGFPYFYFLDTNTEENEDGIITYRLMRNYWDVMWRRVDTLSVQSYYDIGQFKVEENLLSTWSKIGDQVFQNQYLLDEPSSLMDLSRDLEVVSSTLDRVELINERNPTYNIYLDFELLNKGNEVISSVGYLSKFRINKEIDIIEQNILPGKTVFVKVVLRGRRLPRIEENGEWKFIIPTTCIYPMLNPPDIFPEDNCGKIIVINEGLISSINEEESLKDLSIFTLYPNPVSNQELFVKRNLASIDYGLLNLQLMDQNGKVVKSFLIDKYPDESRVNLDGLSPGFYLVVINRVKDQAVLQRTKVVVR